jgi:hypothetical protein
MKRLVTASGLGAGYHFSAVDPALSFDIGLLLRPTCGALMEYPDRRLPAGLVLTPGLAETAVCVKS